MIAETLNAESVWLLTEASQPGTEKLTVGVPADLDRSADGREARSALDGALRTSLEWTAILGQAELNELLDALQTFQDERLVVPVWPLATTGAGWAARAVGGGIVVAWDEGFTAHEINPAHPEDYDFGAPAILARFAAKPVPPDALSALNASVRFAVVEDATADLALAPVAAPAGTGPLIGGVAQPVFPFTPEWSQATPQAGSAEVTVTRAAPGTGRVQATAFYAQTPERPVTATLLLTTAAEIGLLLGWWLARRGAVQPHWVPTWLLPCSLTADAAAGTSTLHVTDATALGGNRYLALCAPGSAPEIVSVTGIAGNILTLAANLANTHTAAGTGVALAMLARHTDAPLALTFQNSYVAGATIAWRELPAEYNTLPDDETRGTTVGALARTAWLYEFEEAWPGGSVFTRATDAGLDLVVGGHTYTDRPIGLSGKVTQAVDLSRQSLTLKTRWWTPGPFDQFMPGGVACRIFVRLYEFQVGTANPPVLRCTGELTGVKFDGPMIEAQVSGPGEIFDRVLPSDVFGRGCNARLFDARCQLNLADWAITAIVTAVAGTSVTLNTLARTGGLPAGFGFAHWFALGMMQRTSGGKTRAWSVYDSTVLAAGALTVTLRQAYTGNIGDAVTLWPGCDKQFTTCQAYNAGTNPTGKFNNAANFRGCPFIPDRAPQFDLPAVSLDQGSKK